MASSGSSGGGGDRRYPRSMEGILHMCTEQTVSEDAPNRPPLEPMSAERRQFLRDAMNSLSANNPIKEMLEFVRQIMLPADTDEDKLGKEAALEELHSYCEDIDLAGDFHKIGGFSLLSPLLNDPSSGLRWRTADLIATLAQNNPYCQQALLDVDILPALVYMLENDGTDMCRIKAMYAISCTTREFPDAQEQFLKKHDGFSVMIRAMQTDIEKLQLKASFMLSSVCKNSPEYKDTVISMGLIDQLISLLHTEHGQYHEHVLSALLVLVEDNTEGQQECLGPHLGLKTLLDTKLGYLAGKDEYQEELEYCQKLLEICFKENDQSVDR